METSALAPDTSASEQVSVQARLPWPGWPWPWPPHPPFPWPPPGPGPYWPLGIAPPPAGNGLTEADYNVIRGVLDILKAYPGGKISSDRDRLRVAITVAYATGYFEAKGYILPQPRLGGLLAAGVPQAELETTYTGLISGLETAINPPAGLKITWRDVWHAVGLALEYIGRKMQGL